MSAKPCDSEPGQGQAKDAGKISTDIELGRAIATFEPPSRSQALKSSLVVSAAMSFAFAILFIARKCIARQR